MKTKKKKKKKKKNMDLGRWTRWAILKPQFLRALYGFLFADVDKSVWVWYEDGLMTFYTSN